MRVTKDGLHATGQLGRHGARIAAIARITPRDDRAIALERGKGLLRADDGRDATFEELYDGSRIATEITVTPDDHGAIAFERGKGADGAV